MGMIGKLSGVASIGGTLASLSLMQKYLGDVTSVIALTIVSSIMVGLLMASGLYGGYIGLIHYGLDPAAAALVIVGVVFLLALATGLMAALKFRQLREMSQLHRQQSLPGLSRVSTIASAFLDGLGMHKARAGK